MLYFESDYMEGCHPEVLEELIKTNMISLSGYGHDEYTESAKEKIKKACNCPTAQVQFITGGTQTNQLVIASTLKLFEGVISADSGHINTHEAGAIEYTGHKVLPLKSNLGKIEADTLSSYLDSFYKDDNREHEIYPGMVYISQPTEYGTLYSKNELTKLSEICRNYKLPLYMDGARLGYALASDSNDLSLSEIAELCDIFYIGGTKCGALCGEAVVFTKNNMPAHFENLQKKHGALLAKGKLIGIQFDKLYTNDLYIKICKNAIECANLLNKGLKEKGYKLLIDSPTNQQFVILENSKMNELKSQVKFCFWEAVDENHTAVRFATSWATTKENVESLLNIL